MNFVILIAGILSLLAFFIHAIAGDQEYRRLKPPPAQETDYQIWLQGRGGWHWISIDLLACGILLLLISASDIITAKSEILNLLGIYFLLCGLTWLGVVLFSREKNRQIFTLGQWIFCILMAALVFLGNGYS